MGDVPFVENASGFKMPIVGFGTWQSPSDEVEKALDYALEVGYRHIDTAYAYNNEAAIGNVLKRWFDAGKLTREEIFITTKLPLFANSPEHVERFMDLSLKSLQLSYVDLYLIHTPFGVKYADDFNMLPKKSDGTLDIDMNTDHKAIWKEMEKLVDNGKARAIGVSNFTAKQVERLLKVARIRPVVNQIQLYVYLQQPKNVKFLQENDIIVTSYSTLGSGGTKLLLQAFGVEKEMPRVLENPVVTQIASEVNRTPAQVLLRHMMQKNIVVIPKSVTPERIKSNFELFDFELSDNQMALLNDLNENLPCFDFADIFRGIETHPEYPLRDVD